MRQKEIPVKLTSLKDVKCPECNTEASVKNFVQFNWLDKKASYIMECKGVECHLFLVLVDINRAIEIS